jgi:hypothetical protein
MPLPIASSLYTMLTRLEKTEADATKARQEAHEAQTNVALLRDQLVAAQRGPANRESTVETALHRGLLARVLNRN